MKVARLVYALQAVGAVPLCLGAQKAMVHMADSQGLHARAQGVGHVADAGV